MRAVFHVNAISTEALLRDGGSLRKILVYSHDTFGLGNIRRMLDISKHLVATNSNVSILIISGSPMVHAFRAAPRIDYIKLPCLVRTSNGGYGVKCLGLGYEAIIRMRTSLITATMRDYSPDLILVDKKPFGVANELLPGLRLLRDRVNPPKVVLLLRDILDSPEATTETWERNRYHEAVKHYYDQILVVGSPEVFDLASEYKFPDSSRTKVRFCGYLRREGGSRTRDEIRDQLGVQDHRLVLVTAGGGEDGFHLLANYVQGFESVSDEAMIKTLLVCGPEMSEPHRNRIHAAASHPDLVVSNFTDDMMGCIDAADLVVSMGGYNTICEVLSLRKRAIIVPRVRPVQEQWIRAERMAQLGLLRTIHPDVMTPTELLGAVICELNGDPETSQKAFEVDLNGMSRVAGCVLSLLNGDNAAKTLTN